jgi:hypothetical protein
MREGAVHFFHRWLLIVVRKSRDEGILSWSGWPRASEPGGAGGRSSFAAVVLPEMIAIQSRCR